MRADVVGWTWSLFGSCVGLVVDEGDVMVKSWCWVVLGRGSSVGMDWLELDVLNG